MDRRLLAALTAACLSGPALLVACQGREPQGLPPADRWTAPPAPAPAARPDPRAELAACVADAVVGEVARLRADGALVLTIDAYRDAPAEVQRIGLRALGAAAQTGLTGGLALARTARALAQAGFTDDAAPLAEAALAQAEGSQPTFTFERTEAIADAAAALAQAGAHARAASHVADDPQIRAAVAAGYARAGDAARADAMLTGAPATDDPGAAVETIAAHAWLGRIDRAQAVVAALPARHRAIAAIALARIAVDAHRPDAGALVTAARDALTAVVPRRDASADERARQREEELSGRVTLARLRLRAGDRLGALADLGALDATITGPTPGLYETAALAEAADIASEAGDDGRADALLARARGGALADLTSPAAQVARLARRGKYAEALDVIAGVAGPTATLHAQVFARAAAAAPMDPAVVRLLRTRICRAR